MDRNPVVNQKLKQTLKLSCPGKVFLLGEYVCLEGAPAILMPSHPSFELEVCPSTDAKRHLPPFAPASPGGVFLLQHAKELAGLELKWRDPYIEKFGSAIGVGSSSAQFLLSVLADDAVLAAEGFKRTPESLLALYWKIIGNSQGLRPSGVDLIAQFTWTKASKRPISVQIRETGTDMRAIVSIFDKTASDRYAFALLYTGEKVRTHEHLKLLHARGFPKDFSEMLQKLGALTERGMKLKHDAEFGAVMNEYQKVLDENHIGSQEFSEQVAQIRGWPGVCGAKGTGSQGGDCILALVEKSKMAEFTNAASMTSIKLLTL